MERGEVEQAEDEGGVLAPSVMEGGDALRLSADKRGKPKFTLSDPENDSLIITGDVCCS